MLSVQVHKGKHISKLKLANVQCGCVLNITGNGSSGKIVNGTEFMPTKNVVISELKGVGYWKGSLLCDIVIL